MDFVKDFLLIVNTLIYRIISFFTQIDKHLIIFEAQNKKMNESCWVLYKYLKNKGVYRFVWIVDKPQQYPITDDTIYIHRNEWISIKANYYFAKAAFSFYTHVTSKVNYKRKGRVIVYIGHGYAIKGYKAVKNDKMIFDYALSIGEKANIVQANFIGCSHELILPLGLPRNDLLLRNVGKGKENPFVVNKLFRKVILWMPTFRESTYAHLSEENCKTSSGLPLFSDENSVYELNNYLRKKQCAIILKIHPAQKEKDIFKRKFSNIIIIHNKDIEKLGLHLYELIGKSDALLSDFSSVSVDYLLLNKPIGYILSDLDNYRKDRGFASNSPMSFMPGHHIYTKGDFEYFIDDILNDTDNYENKRKALVEELHAAPKGNSCELIANYFKL